MNKWVSGEWVIERTNAKQRRILHYWFTIFWFTIGLATWIILRHALWFVGFMSLYAIWVSHLASWAAETPVEPEINGATADHGSPGTADVDTATSLVQAEAN